MKFKKMKKFNLKLFGESALLDYGIWDAMTKGGAQTGTEMSCFDVAFICGLLETYKPKNILEVGVSAGGTTRIIYEAMRKISSDFSLTSVDLNTEWYRDNTRKTAWFMNMAPGEKMNWRLLTGKYLPEVIEGLEAPFDFCILDTVHRMPGELLDYLVALPFMQTGGIFAFHDVILHLCHRSSQYSNQILFDVCVGDKIMLLNSRYGNLPNIAAVKITDDTYKYVANVFMALAMKWSYSLSDNEFFIYYNFFNKYYGEEAATYFGLAREWNEKNLREKPLPIKKERKTDAQLSKLLLRKMLKFILPYGIVNFAQTNRYK